MRVPFFSVVYFSRRTLPQKKGGKRAIRWDLQIYHDGCKDLCIRLAIPQPPAEPPIRDLIRNRCLLWLKYAGDPPKHGQLGSRTDQKNSGGGGGRFEAHRCRWEEPMSNACSWHAQLLKRRGVGRLLHLHRDLAAQGICAGTLVTFNENQKKTLACFGVPCEVLLVLPLRFRPQELLGAPRTKCRYPQS